MMGKLNKDGLTVVEVLITVVIAGIIFSLALSLQFFGLRSFIGGTTQAEIQQDARLADEIIRKQLRNAIYLGTTENNASRKLVFSNNNTISFGKIGGQKISFELSGIGKIILSNVNNGKNVLNIRIEGDKNEYLFSNDILLNNYGHLDVVIGDIENIELGDGANNTIYYSLPGEDD